MVLPSKLEMTQKQEQEVWWVTRLKELLRDFPHGDIHPNQNDPPDVFVRSAGRIVGIEVRRLFRPKVPGEQALQAREGNTKRIVEEARLLHLQAERPRVRVSVHFNRHPIRSNEIRQLAAALAEIVRRNLPAEGQTTEEEYNYRNRSYFPDKIDRVAIYRTVPDGSWVAHEAMWNPDCGADYLQREIDAKTIRYSEAKKKCEEVWLLLVTNAQGLASHVCLSDAAFGSIYTTPYERAFVITFFNKLHELCRNKQ
jgi:hypothetical protein